MGWFSSATRIQIVFFIFEEKNYIKYKFFQQKRDFSHVYLCLFHQISTIFLEYFDNIHQKNDGNYVI